ncbi:MAG: L-2-amino-thiazoline-4-carboxylic acid hydrolase [Deltaproteobacteria bacterium]|nr:L-2-amino-thiazoline-4-carboxylic acid hydrolase [Deltaproteobacteria bacterium]
MRRVRGAMHARARAYACFYLVLAEEFGAEKAEELSRRAIGMTARERGRREGTRTPDEWVDEHAAFSGKVFESTIHKMPDKSEQHMTTCALLDEWKAMGLSPEMQDLLCDIAMEADRQRAAYHGIPCDIVERLGKGDSFCRVVLRKEPK